MDNRKFTQMKKLFLLLILFSNGLNAQLLKTYNFELPGWRSDFCFSCGTQSGYDNADTTYSTTRVNTYASEGTWSARFELRKTDPNIQGSKRTQIWNNYRNTNSNPTGGSLNVYWVSYDLRLGDNATPWIVDNNFPEGISVDYHDNPPNNATSAWTNPQSLWSNGSRFQYRINHDSLDIIADGGAHITNVTFDCGPLIVGQWVHWVVHTNKSPKDSGYVQVWRNDTLVVDYHGKCWYENCAAQPYFKFGIYKFSWTWSGNQNSTTTKRVLFLDNVREWGPATVKADITNAGNLAPVANAGADQTIVLPIDSTVLTVSATDQDGTIASYAWTKIFGPNNPTLSAASSATTKVGATGTHLIEGDYAYKVTVTDNSGGIDLDTVVIHVISVPVVQPPVAVAGPNIAVFEPSTTATLYGTGSFGTSSNIATYAWSFISGPATPSITNASSVNTGLTGLTARGLYTFRLTVTDGNSLTSTDYVYVIVDRRRTWVLKEVN